GVVRRLEFGDRRDRWHVGARRAHSGARQARQRSRAQGAPTRDRVRGVADDGVGRRPPVRALRRAPHVHADAEGSGHRIQDAPANERALGRDDLALRREPTARDRPILEGTKSPCGGDARATLERSLSAQRRRRHRMSKKSTGTVVSPSYRDGLALYERLVATIPEVERKGATMPYTSVNGNMFSLFTKEGTVALRLPADERAAFLA